MGAGEKTGKKKSTPRQMVFCVPQGLKTMEFQADRVKFTYIAPLVCIRVFAVGSAGGVVYLIYCSWVSR